MFVRIDVAAAVMGRLQLVQHPVVCHTNAAAVLL
jgi:hypothetical protein